MNKKSMQALVLCLILSVMACQQKPDPLTDVRNNWNSYIYVDQTHYTFSLIGGIDAFDIPIKNNTNYIIDEATVSITYIKQSGGIYKTEKMSISNIPPNSAKKIKAPSSPRGTSVDVKIINVISRDMKFIFPGSNAAPGDPYLYSS